jgi:predicted transposase YdaD
LIEEYLSQEKLMESEFYRNVFGRGKVEGKAEGQAEGEAKSILAVLAARGIPVSDAVRARVLACTDIATLDLWVRRAAVATTAASVVRAKAPAARRARKG